MEEVFEVMKQALEFMWTTQPFKTILIVATISICIDIVRRRVKTKK